MSYKDIYKFYLTSSSFRGISIKLKFSLLYDSNVMQELE